MFSDVVDVDSLPAVEITFSDEDRKNGKKIIEILRETALCESGGEAKRLIKGGGVKIDDQKIDDTFMVEFDEEKPFFKLALGKKKLFKINLVI
jgi:tyrosyl-tRNA synthetase